MNLNLPQETQNLFFSFAKEKNTTTENLIQEAIIEFLNDLYDAKLAQTSI